jgi:hypothetical protein
LYELKQHRPRFDEEYLRFLDQRKQAKMQWVQEPKQRNVVNLNNIKREVSSHLRNKGKNNSKLKFMTLKLTVRSHASETCIGASVILRRVTSPEIVRDEKGDSATDCHSILARWRNHFYQLFNVHGFSDVSEKEIHTTEPL